MSALQSAKQLPTTRAEMAEAQAKRIGRPDTGMKQGKGKEPMADRGGDSLGARQVPPATSDLQRYRLKDAEQQNLTWPGRPSSKGEVGAKSKVTDQSEVAPPIHRLGQKHA